MKTLIILFFSMSVAFGQSIRYPRTEKIPVIDTYFDIEIQDNYRWLEDDRSTKTADWVSFQNKVTQRYLENIPFRNELKEDIKAIYNYEKRSIPFKKGDFTYYYKNDGLQQHYVLYRIDSKGNETVFLDPNTFSKDGSVSLANISFNQDGSLAAYQISEGGSDWRKVYFLNAKTGEVIEDKLIDVKFSRLAWYKGEGIFYSSYKKDENASELSAKTQNHQLFYHKLGTSQEEDILIFGDEKDPKRYVNGQVSEDQKFLFIEAANNTSGNELHYAFLGERFSEVKPIVNNQDSDVQYFHNEGDIIYLQTNYLAPNNRLVYFDLRQMEAEKWVDIIPEEKYVLNVTKGANHFFAHYMIDANDEVLVYSKDGRKLRQIQFPSKGIVNGFSAEDSEKEVFFTFENKITPATIYSYSVEEDTHTVFYQSKLNFKTDDFITEQIFYNSKDGTKIPMTISYHKNTKRDGNTPTILYGYGGFNISLQPNFSLFAAIWMQNGGIYAVPNLRGGGEYGKNWHIAGTKLQKKNVFDDFIAAAEFLIKNKYTSSNKLALSGGSNGGLLVGAVMNMRPDLARVALPAVGVLDMLRYHTFTSGAGWAYDYGTSEESKEMFEYLLSYSPVHTVKKDVCYPYTLITTGDHDDRVVPAHSFKFAAELQDKQSCKNPTLIRIETQAGHGAGKSTDVIINEYADTMAFTLDAMGIKELIK